MFTLKAPPSHDPYDIEIVDIPIPELKSMDLLVKVKEPLILGQEVPGEVTNKGETVSNVKLGDKEENHLDPVSPVEFFQFVIEAPREMRKNDRG